MLTSFQSLHKILEIFWGRIGPVCALKQTHILASSAGDNSSINAALLAVLQ